MRLQDLITWLESQSARAIIHDGFGAPHAARKSIFDIAFEPVKKTTVGEMLRHAQSVYGQKFERDDPPRFKRDGAGLRFYGHTEVRISSPDKCGEEITSAHLKLWEITLHNVLLEQ